MNLEGVIYLLNEAGIALQQLRSAVAERDQRIAELEAQLAEARTTDSSKEPQGA